MGERNYIGCSELGQCARRVFMSHRGEFDEFHIEDPCALRKMKLGNAGEEIIAEERGDIAGRQLEVTFGPALGHIDGYIPGDPTALWECKVTTAASVNKWRRSVLPRYYLWQINAYMMGLSELLRDSIRTCQLDAMDRTSGEVHHLLFRLDPIAVNEAMQRAVYLERVVENGPIPDREYDLQSTECRYCPFRLKCWEGTDRVESQATGPDVVDGVWEGFSDAIELYTAGKELEEEADRMIDSAKDEIIEALLAHQVKGATAAGFKAVYSQMEQERFDTKKFRAKHPQLWEEFKTLTNVNRLDVRAMKEIK